MAAISESVVSLQAAACRWTHSSLNSRLSNGGSRLEGVSSTSQFLGWPALEIGDKYVRCPKPASRIANLRAIARAAAQKEGAPVGGGQMLVYVPPHPLISHWVAVLRNSATPPPIFHSALAELGRVLIYEASRDWLVTVEAQVETPCGVADIKFVDPREPIQVVPILRAGLVLVEHMATVLPATQTFHLGYVRDEYTLQPSQYLNKLPQSFGPNARVLVADPMLATGGTIVAAIEELKRRGADHRLMRVISAVAAPPALKKLSEKFPGLKVYTGIIDPDVNDRGFIVPGVGDAGDRSFGT